MHVVSVDEGEHSEEAARGEWHPQRPAPGVARRGCDTTRCVARCRAVPATGVN